MHMSPYIYDVRISVFIYQIYFLVLNLHDAVGEDTFQITTVWDWELDHEVGNQNSCDVASVPIYINEHETVSAIT